MITLQTGQGAVIVSNPSGSDVSIDGKVVGKTPLSINDMSGGEHEFILTHQNFLQESVKAQAADEFQLVLNVDLAISPTEQTSNASPLPTPPTTQVLVAQTPTGFLNIRDSASIQGKVVGQASSGDTLALILEQGAWDKIQTKDGIVGFVSSQYIQKKSP